MDRSFITSVLIALFSLWTLVVEPQYTGARTEGDVVTLAFVKKMMDDFKNQKSLHKRYGWEKPDMISSITL